MLLPTTTASQCRSDAQAAAPKQLTRQLTPPRVQQSVAQEDPKYKGRVVAIATEGARAGRAIMHWAARNLLEKRDHVHVLRVLPKSGGGSGSGNAAPTTQSLGETLQALNNTILTCLHAIKYPVVQSIEGRFCRYTEPQMHTSCSQTVRAAAALTPAGGVRFLSVQARLRRTCSAMCSMALRS